MLKFNLSIIIAAGFEKINPYAKFGFIFGTGSIFFEYNENDNGDIFKEKTKYNGGSAFGLNAAIGVLYKLKDRISVFAELNMVNLSYAPKKGEVTNATYNGDDVLNYYYSYDKDTEFVDTYTYNYNNPSADTEPRELLKQKFPFGSVGINLGLQFNF
jgi:hypothetical protein